MATPKFLDQSQFTGEINILFQSDSIDKQFSDFAATFEKDVLTELLGITLYNEFIADINENNVPQTQKFIDLLNGVVYNLESNGRPIEYKGLLLMLQYLVFDAFIQSRNFTFTPNGTLSVDTENTKQVSNYDTKYKATRNIYNKGVRMYNEAILFVYEKRNDYFINGDTTFWIPKPLNSRHQIQTMQSSVNKFNNFCK